MANLAQIEQEETQCPVWLNRPLPFDGYKYKDYKNWDDGVNVELLEGVPYMMASPGERHQWLTSDLNKQLRNQLDEYTSQVYSGLDVRLFYEKDETDNTVVRPDLMVVCDESKVMDKMNCEGVPDFILEVVSKNSAGKDLVDKKRIYSEARVKEFWFVNEGTVFQYILEGALYMEKEHKLIKGFKLPVSSVDGCCLDFSSYVVRYKI